MRMLSVRATELLEASELIENQLVHWNRIWVSSMVDRNIGGDVSLLLKDVRHVEVTGRNREPTWARPGDRDAARRSRNTMGYQVRER